jgi:signal transduction histidine kinase
MTDDAKDQPERIQTDESLRRERERADRALAATQQRVEAAAAAVVRSVQEGAEARVEEARAEADEKAVHHGPSTEGQRLAHAEAHAQVEAGRAAADQAALEEQEAAEEALRRARQEQARVLARLLPLEREKTDRYLLTERRRADDAVAHRDDFLNIVTHDLRNLLSGIVLSSDALAEIATEGDPGPILQSTTARIQRYAARMNRLIEDLVDVGSIDRGSLAIEPAQGDLAPLLAEAVDGFASTAEAKGITLKHPHLDPPLLATFDRGRILQVLANLLSNAIKFTPRGGEVDLRSERTSDALRISVGDTGGGIAETMLEAVFERFWQVGKNDRRGMGLGLYISRSIVEAHGGTIWVESQLGHGARFTFELPARGP